MTTRLGMMREWKTDAERRAPLTPGDVAALVASGLEVVVESSPVRVHADAEYAEVGAILAQDLGECDFYLGIKEAPIDRIRPRKPHLFFSHTHKGQAYNLPLLKRVLEAEATLLDFELVTDDDGLRLIFFGVQAGQAGMINSLWSLGRRLAVLGVDTPLAALRQAREYASLVDAKAAVREVGDAIRRDGLPEDLCPLVVGITGIGNVSRGAQEVLDELRPATIAPPDLLGGAPEDSDPRRTVYKCVFDECDMVRPKHGQPFDQAEYRAEPDRYVGRFADYLPHLTLLVAGNYWDERYPRLVTREWLARHHRETAKPKLLVIGDVSCDIEGGVECTLEATLPDDPVYVYDPSTAAMTRGFEGPGVLMMAVDILPTELPRESSAVFGSFLRPFLADVASADYDVALEDLAIPAPFRRAIIAHRGRLAPEHEWLRERLG